MMLLNLLAIQHPGKGLPDVKKTQRKIWEKFSDTERRKELPTIAQKIRSKMSGEDTG